MKDEEHYAGRFSAEVDRILEQRGRSEEEGPPAEYDEMLAMAEWLAALDFSKDSSLRSQLRGRLMNALEGERTAAQRRPVWWRRLLQPKPRRVLGAVVAVMALVVLVGWTPAGRALAQAVEQFIREMRWPNTTVQQIFPDQRPTATADPRQNLENELAAGRAWQFEFEGRGFAGCCSPDVRNEVVSLEQAIAEAGFDLYLPTVLPAGYVVSEVRLLDVSPYLVFIIYEGPDGRLGLEQSVVGITSEEHPGPNTAILERRAVSVVTDGTVEEVMVGATPAALIDGDSLAWEENNISFRLIGPGLNARTLIQTAESLELARKSND